MPFFHKRSDSADSLITSNDRWVTPYESPILFLPVPVHGFLKNASKSLMCNG